MSAKARLRNVVAGFLFRTDLTAAVRLSRGYLSIATFHRVLPEEQRRADPYPASLSHP